MAVLFLACHKEPARNPWLQESELLTCANRAAKHFDNLRDASPERLKHESLFLPGTAIGVAIVQPGHAYSGPLTQWSPTEKLQVQNYGSPSDCYSYLVDAACRFLEPCTEIVNANFSLGRGHRAESRLHPLTGPSFSACLKHKVHGRDGVSDLASFLTRHLQCDLVSLKRRPCLCARLPTPLAVAVSGGELLQLVMLGRWPCKARFFADFPPNHLLERKRERLPVLEATPMTDNSADVCKQPCKNLSSFLRGVAPHLLQHPPEGFDSDLMKRLLETHVVNC